MTAIYPDSLFLCLGVISCPLMLLQTQKMTVTTQVIMRSVLHGNHALSGARNFRVMYRVNKSEAEAEFNPGFERNRVRRSKCP